MRKLILALIVTALFFSSCKKETKALRSKVYALRAYNNSGLTGQVSFLETANKDSVTVKLEAQNLLLNTVYLTHLHTGTPGNLTGTLIYFHDVQTSTGSVVQERSWGISFESAVVSNTCFTMHEPSFFSNDTIGYVLAGNTGGNAP